MSKKVIVGGMRFREYQKPVVKYFDEGGHRASLIWHRRSGKDRVALNIAVRRAFQRVGTYWHCLPTHKQARKVVWDNITKDGQRLIDATFPSVIVAKRNETEMKIELTNGSIIQLVGADNIDANIGANLAGVTFSEFAVTHPLAWDFIRPIIVENDGYACFITTPRGYNHAFKLHEAMKASAQCFTSLLTVEDTNIVSVEQIEEERRLGMPEELIRQEFYCDFSAANVGAIFGRYIEAADKEGRVQLNPRLYERDAGPIHATLDIGYRDATAVWFWQCYADGFGLIDYYEGTGMDASDWIERLETLPYTIDTIWLPHDARAKTFATKNTVVSQFLEAKERLNAKHVKVVPVAKLQDQINAGRTILPRCRFDAAACTQGLAALREYSFKYDEERRTFSAEPEHNWASHGASAFMQGAMVLREFVKPVPISTRDVRQAGSSYAFNLEDLWADREKMRVGQHFTRI